MNWKYNFMSLNETPSELMSINPDKKPDTPIKGFDAGIPQDVQDAYMSDRSLHGYYGEGKDTIVVPSNLFVALTETYNDETLYMRRYFGYARAKDKKYPYQFQHNRSMEIRKNGKYNLIVSLDWLGEEGSLESVKDLVEYYKVENIQELCVIMHPTDGDRLRIDWDLNTGDINKVTMKQSRTKEGDIPEERPTSKLEISQNQLDQLFNAANPEETSIFRYVDPKEGSLYEVEYDKTSDMLLIKRTKEGKVVDEVKIPRSQDAYDVLDLLVPKPVKVNPMTASIKDDNSWRSSGDIFRELGIHWKRQNYTSILSE